MDGAHAVTSTFYHLLPLSSDLSCCTRGNKTIRSTHRQGTLSLAKASCSTSAFTHIESAAVVQRTQAYVYYDTRANPTLGYNTRVKPNPDKSAAQIRTRRHAYPLRAVADPKSRRDLAHAPRTCLGVYRRLSLGRPIRKQRVPHRESRSTDQHNTEPPIGRHTQGGRISPVKCPSCPPPLPYLRSCQNQLCLTLKHRNELQSENNSQEFSCPVSTVISLQSPVCRRIVNLNIWK